MLERTAAGLELTSTNFRRVLPRSTRPARHRRRPQTTRSFSQHHGPSAWDTPAACSSRPGPACPPPSPQHISRAESSVLLDFLYPKQTHALLRRDHRPALRPRNHAERTNSPQIKCYASSTASGRAKDAGTPQGVPNPTTENMPDPRGKVKPSRWGSAKIAPKDTYTVQSDGSDDMAVQSAEQFALMEALRKPAHETQGRSKRKATLPELLKDKEGDLYLDVWDLYCRLGPNERRAVRPSVIGYLSRSRSVVEMGRAISLFRQVPTDDWDNDFLSSSVLTLLRSDDQAYAIEIFKTGLRTKNLVGGFEYLLLDTVNKQQWDTMLNIWIEYCKHASRLEHDTGPDEGLLDSLTSLPSLGALYFSFERHLAKDDMEAERWMDVDDESKVALRILRRKFAVTALRQPCPPKQASIILDFWRDHGMYERYLWRMFDRWYTKKISTATARMLPAIYQNYRKLPGAKPSLDIMRGIFKVNYPTGVAALEQLYEDWVRNWGELNHWGFEKFLKFFAYRGDVDRVKELWRRYVQHFPSRLKTPRGFRSIINVYAQSGDVAGAEQELENMASHYKVKPDLDTWNMLLKCYTRAGDYARVLSSFDQICSMHNPDSFTYTHVMAMASKKGDLDTVLRFFNDAQKSGVPISKEMGLALVVAYCENGQLVDAENICIDLAQRRITSTTIWNQLLHYNGLRGRLNKCYELLNAMKKYNLEWNHETIGSLLQALVRVNQVSPAFQVLRDAIKNKLHVLQPEHFATVMLGAVRTGDRVTAEALMSLMEKASVSVPFNAMVSYTQAALKEAPNAVRTPSLGRQMVACLRALVREQGGDIRRLRRETQSIGRAVQLLVQFRDFASVEELINLFIDLFPQYKEDEPMPQDVTASLMLAYHRDENYDRVVELWRESWPRILKRSSKMDGKGIYPAHEYDVTRLVFRMADTLRAMKDGEGLLECVDQVTAAGFKLTSSTWDRVIRGLAELGQWDQAMYWCETMLMPEWRGWYPEKQPLNKRREALNPRVLQPSPQAVLALQREWLETRKLAAWSPKVTRKLADMEQRYPRLHQAFVTSHYGDMPGPWVFRGDVDSVKAIREMLSPLPLEELREMEKALEKQLAREPRVDDSPFGRLGTDAESVEVLQQDELQQLRAVLRHKLMEKRTTSADEEKLLEQARDEKAEQHVS